MKGHKSAMSHLKKATASHAKTTHHLKNAHNALGSMGHIKSAEKFEKKYRGHAKKAKVG